MRGGEGGTCQTGDEPFFSLSTNCEDGGGGKSSSLAASRLLSLRFRSREPRSLSSQSNASAHTHARFLSTTLPFSVRRESTLSFSLSLSCRHERRSVSAKKREGLKKKGRRLARWSAFVFCAGLPSSLLFFLIPAPPTLRAPGHAQTATARTRRPRACPAQHRASKRTKGEPPLTQNAAIPPSVLSFPSLSNNPFFAARRRRRFRRWRSRQPP